MAGECTIRIERSGLQPFRYSATYVLVGLAAAASPLEPHYLYGGGDLAVFLEDLGVPVPVILKVLDRLGEEETAEAPVSVPDEILEVLSRHNQNAH